MIESFLSIQEKSYYLSPLNLLNSQYKSYCNERLSAQIMVILILNEIILSIYSHIDLISNVLKLTFQRKRIYQCNYFLTRNIYMILWRKYFINIKIRCYVRLHRVTNLFIFNFRIFHFLGNKLGSIR